MPAQDEPPRGAKGDGIRELERDIAAPELSRSWRAAPAMRQARGILRRIVELCRRQMLRWPLWMAKTTGRSVILMVDGIYPRPDRDSGSVDAAQFVEAFAQLGHYVVFVSSLGLARGDDREYRRRLHRLGVATLPKAAGGSFERFLVGCGDLVDVAFLSRAPIAGRWMEVVKRHAPQAKIIFNTVDLHHLRIAREASYSSRRNEMIAAAARIKQQEIALAEAADLTIVVSSDERRILQSIAPSARVIHLPVWRELHRGSVEFSHRRGIGFIGGFAHTPNVDAVEGFLNSSWPLIRRRLGDVEFVVIGADLPSSIASRSDPGFRAVGHVEDLAPLMSTLRLTVAPLRFGAGIKGKVLTSLAFGTPCVVSPIASEGLELGMPVAEIGTEFAETVVRVYQDEQLWEHLSLTGQAALAARHSPEDRNEAMRLLLSNLVAS